MRRSALRQACGLLFNLLALLCILQNLWESTVPVVRYAWIPAAAAAVYVIVRGWKALRLFLRSRDSDAACLIFLAATAFLSLFFASGLGAEWVNIRRWGTVVGSVARVLRFHVMFGSWWFLGLSSVLGASLAAKVIWKRAWRAKSAGLTGARAGLLLLLLAGVIWKTIGARCWMQLPEGGRSRIALDADAMGSFDLPFAVRLDGVRAGAHVTIITDEGAVAGADLPTSWGSWRICAHGLRQGGANLYLVHDPAWPLAAVGLVLIAGGLALDAAAGRKKREAPA